MSLMLQDHIFPVAWFSMWMKCPLHSMQTILYPGLHFKSHLPVVYSQSRHDLQFERLISLLLESFDEW